MQPLELNTNRISVRVKDDVAKYVNHSEPKILSDNSAPLYARQLALHANVSHLTFTIAIFNVLKPRTFLVGFARISVAEE